MPRPKLSPVLATRRRVRTAIYLSPTQLAALDELANLQQELCLRSASLNMPRPVRPPFSQESWYQHPVGYDVFLRLRESQTFTFEAFEKSYNDWWDAKNLGKPSRAQEDKFPPAHCAGLVVGRLLEKHGDELIRELKREYEKQDQSSSQ